MHELARKSTAAPTPPPPSGPAVSPPVIRPEEFEDYPAFRETFLLYFADPLANATLRNFGILLHEMVLDFWGHWPNHPEGLFPAELRAAVADLRHVQGALQEWTGAARPLESEYDRRLAEVGADVARKIGEQTDRLEAELDFFLGGVS